MYTLPNRCTDAYRRRAASCLSCVSPRSFALSTAGRMPESLSTREAGQVCGAAVVQEIQCPIYLPLRAGGRSFESAILAVIIHMPTGWNRLEFAISSGLFRGGRKRPASRRGKLRAAPLRWASRVPDNVTSSQQTSCSAAHPWRRRVPCRTMALPVDLTEHGGAGEVKGVLNERGDRATRGRRPSRARADDRRPLA